MAKLTNSTIYGSANITGNVVSTGQVFDISANSGINISSANTITGVVYTNTGSQYLSVPAVIFSNTTTGGVTANANAVMRFSGTIAVGNVGSGYVNGDILFANVAGALQNAWFTVTSNTATTFGVGGINGVSIGTYGSYFTIPPGSNTLNPYITITGTTSATGVGANLRSLSGMAVANLYFSNFGSGYVEQPTITFSGGSPFTIAAAYPLVGTSSKIQNLSNTLDFYGANNVNILRLFSNNSTGYATNGTVPALSIMPAQSNFGATVVSSQSGLYFNAVVTGPTPIAFLTGASNPTLSGTTFGSQQFGISHTTSAVNYFTVTGNTTGNGPTLSTQGTDTNIDLNLLTKGIGNVNLIAANTVVSGNVIINSTINGVYTDNLRYAANGLPWVMGSGGGGGSANIDQWVRDTANVTIGVDASQNVRIDYSNTALTIAQGVDNSQNVRIDYSNSAITIIQGTDTSQNSRMVIIEGTDVGQNSRMTIIEGTDASQNVRLDYSNTALTIAQGVNDSQNTRMTISENTNVSQNVRLDYSNAAITIIQGTDTSQNARMTIIEGTDVSQNARIAVSEGVDLSQNTRLDYSNAAITIIQGTDTSQNSRMVIIEGTNASQNVRLDYSNTAITILQGVNVSQNARMAIIEGVDATQNTNINNKLSLTGAPNQTVSGNVTISQDLIVSGNLIITGNIGSQNVQQLAVSDPLIILGIGNYTSDTKDIGFAAHYNDGTNAHAGLIRDFGTKEFYVFQGYTPEVDVTNNIDINDASFSKANLNASYIKSNLIATTAIVNGIDLSTYTQAAYAQANVTIGVDATQNVRIDYSNTALTIAQGVDNSQNVRLDYSNTAITIIQGTDVSQNSRMTIIEGVNASQNVRIDYSNSALTIAQGVDNSQNVRIDYSNTAITIIQGVDTSQNARMVIIEGTDVSQNARMAIIEGTDVSQNSRMTISDGVNASQNVRLNYSNTAITIIQGTDIGQNSRMTIIEGVDASQNTRLDYSNTVITIVQGVDVSQNSRMVIIEGTDVGQNSRMTIIEGTDVSQNSRMAIIEGVNASQNVRLDFSNTRITISDGVNASQNANIVSVQVLANTDVTYTTPTAGVYGSSSLVPVVTVASNGRITSITTAAVSGGSGSSSNSFSTIKISGQPDLIANTSISPLTIVAGSGISLSTVGTSNTLTISSTGGFSGGTIANQLIVANTLSSFSNSNNALQVSGGVGVANSVYVGNRVGFGNTSTSLAYTTYNPIFNSVDLIFG
jgi:hypothetical protein